jgi:hypothetical protein
MCKSILEKYRPIRLAEVVGQPEVVAALSAFVKTPTPIAFLLSGETGTGKSASANELGCAVDFGELGGLHSIPAGEQTAESVRKLLGLIGHRPFYGSGWKVVVINEADFMSRVAEAVWLDALEDIPDHVVYVFTTNEPGKLSQRFRDRCVSFKFRSDSSCLGAAQWLVDRVWRGETGRMDSPRVSSLSGTASAGGNVSFRRILQSLAEVLLLPLPPVSAPAPLDNEPKDDPEVDPDEEPPEIASGADWRDGPCWYITVRDGSRLGLLVGPFAYEYQAKVLLTDARESARAKYGRTSLSYRYGVERRPNGQTIGKLNDSCGYMLADYSPESEAALIGGAQ